MAEVYEAVHRGLKKTVALKVLLPDIAENEDLRARFLREGEAAARIRHPHVVDVTDVGEEDGVPYLVMELLEGEPLSQALASSPRLSVSRALDILLPIAAALTEAHRRGVVHRDLKPENVFIAKTASGKAVPKLLDFGVSKLMHTGAPNATATSAVLGTPHYMAPEQALGLSVIDERADQYSFALMVYECVTGRLPYESENVVALLHEAARGVSKPPSAYLTSLPSSLDEALLRALSADPKARFHSMAELTSRLLPLASARAAHAYCVLMGERPETAEAPASIPPPRSEITAEFYIEEPRKPPAGVRVLRPPAAPAALVATADLTHTSPTRRDPPTAPPSAPSPVAPSPSAAPSPVAPGPVAPSPVGPGPLAALAPSALAPGLPATPSTHAAPDVAVSSAPPASSSSRLWVIGSVAALLIGAATTWWFAVGRTAPPTPPPETSAHEEGQGTTPVAPETPPTSAPALPTTTVPATTAPPPTVLRVVVVATPATATLSLDAEAAVRGALDASIEVDGREHTVVVRAPGFVSQTVRFTDQPPPPRVTLVRAQRTGSGAATGSVSAGSGRGDRHGDDEEIRSER